MAGQRTKLIKILLLIIAIAINFKHYLLRLEDLQGIGSLVLYLGLFAFVCSGIFAAAFAPKLWIRLLWGVLFVAVSIPNDAFTTATGSFLTYDSFVMMAKSIDFAPEASEQYAGALVAAIPAAVLLLVATLLPPGGVSERFSPWIVGTVSLVYPLVVALLLAVLLYARGGHGSNGLPSPYVPLALATLYGYDFFNEAQGERKEVEIPLTENTQSGTTFDIVYIIDESIRGDYLDINNRNGATSGLEMPPPGAKLFNFGLGASATNCSIGTNLVLRYGGTRRDYHRFINTMPSIWQYAKGAGFKSVFIDAQSEDKLYNGMKEEEIAQIDQIIQFKSTLPRDRDIAAAEKLVELINDDTRQFILINKLGGHFPIHDKYPDDYLIHKPALPRGEFADVAIVRDIFGSSEVNWEKYKNAYKNTISWSVGRFFGTIFEQADLDKAIILYTSDHGQNFHERGDPGIATHCVYGGKASMEEGVIPTVVIAGSPLKTGLSAETVSQNLNRVSHYNIFATVLTWMGYLPEPVTAEYGQSLLTVVKDPLTFNVRPSARFGRPAKWIKINIDDIRYPN